MYGEEEKNVIIPAIERARDNGIMLWDLMRRTDCSCGVEFEKFECYSGHVSRPGDDSFQNDRG